MCSSFSFSTILKYQNDNHRKRQFHRNDGTSKRRGRSFHPIIVIIIAMTAIAMDSSGKRGRRDDSACSMRRAHRSHTTPVSRRANLNNVNLIYGQSRRLFEICIGPMRDERICRQESRRARRESRLWEREEAEIESVARGDQRGRLGRANERITR